MLGKTPSDIQRDAEREEDRAALNDLRESFDRVHGRTNRLEDELLRINADLRRAKGK